MMITDACVWRSNANDPWQFRHWHSFGFMRGFSLVFVFLIIIFFGYYFRFFLVFSCFLNESHSIFDSDSEFRSVTEKKKKNETTFLFDLYTIKSLEIRYSIISHTFENIPLREPVENNSHFFMNQIDHRQSEMQHPFSF